MNIDNISLKNSSPFSPTPDSLLPRADKLIKENKPEEAINLYKKAGDYFKNNNEIEKALEIYIKLLNIKEDRQILFDIADLYKTSEKPEKALELYSKILNIDGNNEKALREFTKINFELKKYDKTIISLRKLANLEPEEIDVFEWTGFIFERNKKNRKAIVNYLKAAGNAEKKGFYNKAEELYLKVLQLNPTHREAQKELKKIKEILSSKEDLKKEALEKIKEEETEKVREETIEPTEEIREEETETITEEVREETVKKAEEVETVTEEVREEKVEQTEEVIEKETETVTEEVREETVEQTEEEVREEIKEERIEQTEEKAREEAGEEVKEKFIKKAKEQYKKPKVIEVEKVFEYRNTDNVYLDLFKELIKDCGPSLITSLQSKKEKLDDRFFQILDYKMNFAEKGSELSEKLTYLNNILNNLNLRKTILPEKESLSRSPEATREKTVIVKEVTEEKIENKIIKEVTEEKIENKIIKEDTEAEEDFFVYREADALYLNLLEELEKERETAMILFVQSEREKLDNRFFEIFDYKMKYTLKHKPERANKLIYLNNVINNLKLREKITCKKEEIKEEIVLSPTGAIKKESREEENFEFREDDKEYFELIEELLNERGPSLLMALQSEREKLDERFFEIFNYQMNYTLKNEPQLLTNYTYLKNVLENLKLRKDLMSHEEDEIKKDDEKKTSVKKESTEILDEEKRENFYDEIDEKILDNEEREYFYDEIYEEERDEIFEFKESDEVYLKLLEELTKEHGTALILYVQSEQKKIDGRFFEILDYQTRDTLKHEPEQANKLIYLNNILESLNLRQGSGGYEEPEQVTLEIEDATELEQVILQEEGKKEDLFPEGDKKPAEDALSVEKTEIKEDKIILDETFTIRKSDEDYLELLEALLNERGTTLIMALQSERDKIDERFFEIFDYKMKCVIEEGQEEVLPGYTYLNNVLNNLKLRKKSVPAIFEEKIIQEDRIVSVEKKMEMEEVSPEEKADPVIVQSAYVDVCLKKLIEKGANELHLSTGQKPMIRFWGELQTLDMPVFIQDISDILMAQMLSEEEREELENNMSVDFIYILELPDEQPYRFRSNAYYHRTGLNVVMRQMPTRIPELKELKLPEIISALGRFPRGLVLITGRPDCGKTTTIHALLNLINKERNAHIITIEDPIEFIHRPENSIIRQRQIEIHTKNYNSALKASIREDPDVILVSELRDLETIQLAIAAAESGCLVLSTMNTTGTVKTIYRLIDSFPPDERPRVGAMLSDSLRAIITQQLIPSADKTTRYPALEILIGCTPLASLIREQRAHQINSLIETSKSIGMQSMDTALLKLLEKEMISYDIAYEEAVNKSIIENFVNQKKPLRNGMVEPDQDSLINEQKCEEVGLLLKPLKKPLIQVMNSYLSQDYNLRNLFRIMLKEKASDLHISIGLPPKLRLKGELMELDLSPVTKEKAAYLIFDILTEKQSNLFKKKWDLDIIYELPGLGRFRSNIMKEEAGTGAVFRVIPPEIPSFEELYLPEVLKKVTGYKDGLVIITGPTGSGKTTTMACLTDYINQTRSANVLTIEEPVEFIHKNKKSQVIHREVGVHTPSFADSVRVARREYVDVIMIGEMTDGKTLSEAIHAAETGTLVFGIMNITGITRTIERIIETFPAHIHGQVRSMLSGCLKAIISQQLIPTIDGKGRCAVVEVALINQSMENIIREGKTQMINSVIHSSRDEGMQSLDIALLTLVRDGKIDEESARLRSSRPHSFIVPAEFKPLQHQI